MTSATQGFITTFEILPSGLLSSESIDAYQTRNSGGKANAIDVRTFEERELLVLTDDEEGWVEILEWNQVGLVKRGEVQLKENVGIVGASHAVWLQ